MIVLIPRKWGVLIVHLKYDRQVKKWRGRINTKPVPMSFVTKDFKNIIAAAHWAWESNGGKKV